ncbi:MAG: hypothetical protein AAB446_01635 [Patescibacteria group bacterium]
MITIDDFKKVEIRAGKILSAEPVEGSEKLLKLSVDFGPASAEASAGEGRNIRQVLSGIAKFVTIEELVGTTCAFVTNLEPREMMGLKSEAMIMAFSGNKTETSDGFFSLLKVPETVLPGTKVK